MTIQLRDATDNDREHCVRLLEALKEATGNGARIELGDALESLVSQERGQIVIAEEDGVVLGMASVSYNVALRYGGEYCQLEELIVTPEARGKKLGALLMQRVVDNAKTRGCAEVGLYLVASTEGNRAFYEKCGFEVVGTEMRQQLSE